MDGKTESDYQTELGKEKITKGKKKMKLNEIKKAFGIRGDLTYKAMDRSRYLVYLDGEYFGVYDLDKNTFVD